MLIAAGPLLVLVVIAATGCLVAQALGRVAAGRGRPQREGVRVTERLSFMLSGARSGITVTALIADSTTRPVRCRVS